MIRLQYTYKPQGAVVSRLQYTYRPQGAVVSWLQYTYKPQGAVMRSDLWLTHTGFNSYLKRHSTDVHINVY